MYATANQVQDHHEQRSISTMMAPLNAPRKRLPGMKPLVTALIVTLCLVLVLAWVWVTHRDGQQTIEPTALELSGHRALQRVIRESGDQLETFTTDGCSGGLSTAWRVVAEEYPEFADAHGGQPPWEACCITHDRAYHAGGRLERTHDDFQARVAADRALRSCVVEAGTAGAADLAAHYDTGEAEILAAYRRIGEAMYVAVRLGGAPCSGLPWRWGFGSPDCLVKPVDLNGGAE